MSDQLHRVFLSYRREPSLDLAQQIYNNLFLRGYDVFLDIHTLGAGRFIPQLKDEIQQRTCFVLLLAPSTLARCFQADGRPNPDDVLRQEIEHALAYERPIVPVLHDGFIFSSPYLTGKFKDLGTYQYLDLSAKRSFPAAMDELCNKYLDATSAEEYEARAESALLCGNTNAALENLSEGIVASLYDGQRARLRFKRAELHYGRGRYPMAITDYSWALQHGYSELDDIYANRGSAYYHSGDYAGAISDFSKGLELTPRSWIYTNRGEALFASGEYGKALDDFNSSLQLVPARPSALAGLAISQYALGKKEFARQIWQDLLHRDERYHDAAWVQDQFKWVDALTQAVRDLIRECHLSPAPSSEL